MLHLPRGRAVVLTAAVCALAACAQRAETVVGTLGPQVSVTVAPLTLPGVADVAYDLRVTTAGGATVWQRAGVRASAFGDGTGLTYVGPCDASPAAQPNTVSLTVAALYDAQGLLDDWANPTASAPLTRSLSCAENADVAVTFDVTIMRRARQGFFDIGVEFDDIFCSAKFDCDGAGHPVSLVHGPDGQRMPSAILAFACTGGPGADTWLYLDDLTLSCGGVDTVIPVDGGPGNLYGQAEPAPAPLAQAMIFRGLEHLAQQGTDLGKRYVSVALAVDFTRTTGSCTLVTRGTASDGPLADGTTPAGSYPLIRWEVPLVAASGDAYACGPRPLDDPSGTAGDQVVSTYVTGPPGYGFDVGFHADGGALVPTRVGAECAPGDEPPEGLCLGVCALTPSTCVDGRWRCDGPGYEPVEETCDGFDNDCDGEVDEGDVCVTSCEEDGTCSTCTPNLTVARQHLTAMADVDFDYDCNTYLTTLISGPDYTKVISPAGVVRTYYGNANQNMTFALVDPDPNNRRTVVTYSCCAACGCEAKNGLTLMYTCDTASDPSCGCAGQTHCPGFLDTAFITTGQLGVPGVAGLETPTGLAAGPGNRYYVGNFRSDMCTNAAGCQRCDDSNPGHWCTPSGPNCCASTTLGRLVEFTLPAPGVAPRWRLAYDFGSESIVGLASARDGSVLVGTRVHSDGSGHLYRYDPVARSVTLLQSYPSYVFSITQDRRNGDLYVELGAGNPKLLRLTEAGLAAALPTGIPAAPSGRGVLQYGPDARLYRLNFVGGPLDAYDLP